MKASFESLKPILAAVGACLVVAAAAGAACAEDASPWSRDTRSGMRLIAGSSGQDAPRLRAGIEIELAQGWKTYWRYPGDSGVPPRFDFSGSDNVGDAKVLWPAPHLYDDESGSVIGYKDNVVFPLQITPLDPSKPVRLRLKIDYAVCEKLCVPAEGKAELTLSRSAAAQDALIAAAEAQVPKSVSPQQAGLSARRVNGGPRPLVNVDVAVPNEKNVALLVEGPNPDWALPIPKPASGAPAGHRHFAFELDGLPPGGDPKGPVDLTFTILRADGAVETTTHLD